MIERFAVMGNPIAHSLSPLIHQLFAKQMGKTLVFEKIESDLQRFEQDVDVFFKEGGKGLSITLPFKERAFAMSAHPTLRCMAAKAANTLWIKAGHLQVDNTDGAGLLVDLERYVNLAGLRILVLGAGGAVRGVLGPLLAARPAELTIANRALERARLLQEDYPQINICSLDALRRSTCKQPLGACEKIDQRPFDIVINATSASLDHQALNLPESLLEAKPFCYDLAYHLDKPTVFVAWAKAHGCDAVDGLGMLVEQAAEAFSLWHAQVPETTQVFALLRKKSFDGF